MISREGVVADFKTEFGRALKQQRQRRKLTQIQLAELADLSARYIAEIEAGKANLTMKMMERLATALEWDPLAELTVKAEPTDRDVLDKLTELGQSLEHTIDRLKILHAKYGIDSDEHTLDNPSSPTRGARSATTRKRKPNHKIH
jgi:transcriptional regulator with XRE-family HTH domain